MMGEGPIATLNSGAPAGCGRCRPEGYPRTDCPHRTGDIRHTTTDNPVRGRIRVLLHRTGVLLHCRTAGR